MRKPTYNVYVTQETQPDENGEKIRTGRKSVRPSHTTASRV